MFYIKGSFYIKGCDKAARGLYRAEPIPTRAPGRLKTSLTFLPSEGPRGRVSRESNPGLPIHSPARYLYPTAAGNRIPGDQPHKVRKKGRYCKFFIHA